MFTLNWKAVCCLFTTWNSSMALVYKTVLFETMMLSFGIFNNSHISDTSLKRVRSCALDCWHSWHIHWPVFDWRLQLVVRCAQNRASQLFIGINKFISSKEALRKFVLSEHASLCLSLDEYWQREYKIQEYKNTNKQIIFLYSSVFAL